MKLLNALLDAVSGTEQRLQPVVIQRESRLFPAGRHRSSDRSHDTARHRRYHHYYEDLLS